jgi:hypothetical protein
VIVTVPNTGTRSLREHLGNTSLFHFGRHEDRYREREEPISTTVRDPLRTLISWHDRHGGEHDFFRCHDLMIDTCRAGTFLSWPHGVDYYLTDELPVHEAKGEPSTLKRLYDEQDLLHLIMLDSVRYLIEWMKCAPVHEFYAEHLGPLWWQHDQT